MWHIRRNSTSHPLEQPGTIVILSGQRICLSGQGAMLIGSLCCDCLNSPISLQRFRMCSTIMTWPLGPKTENANTPLGWAREPRPTWRGSARYAGRTDDVGLELLVLFFQEKRINSRSHRRPQTHLPMQEIEDSMQSMTWLLPNCQKRKFTFPPCGFMEKL